MYRVSVKKNSTPTVVTAVLNIPLQSVSVEPLQSRLDLKPTEWETLMTEDEIQSKMIEVIQKCEADFRNYRLNYIDQILKYVTSMEDMDLHVQQEMERFKDAQYTRKCEACSMLHLPRKQKCSCGGRVSSINVHESENSATGVTNKMPKYFDIGEILNMNTSDLSLNEPIMKNPNSRESLIYILDTLKCRLIDKNRKWVFIGADGPPYAIMRRIISAEPEKYDWVILVSGKGHLGMNQVKTFFKVIDKIFGEVLGKKVLNFTTDKSYAYFINCKDTHKAWESLEVFLHGMTMELLVLYIKKCPLSVPTAIDFLEWQKQVGATSPTFKFILQLTFNVALSIYVQRIGDRNNDKKCSDAGRYKFSNMFFAFNHPIYREVEYSELRREVLFPPEIAELRNKNISFSTKTSKIGNNHEGGDFKLENQIQNIKELAVLC